MGIERNNVDARLVTDKHRHTETESSLRMRAEG